MMVYFMLSPVPAGTWLQSKFRFLTLFSGKHARWLVGSLGGDHPRS
jgi:hypothetical protein